MLALSSVARTMMTIVLAGAPAAHAATAVDLYPQKPVRFIVPFVPGAGTDMLAQSFSSSALMAGASMTSGGGIALDGMRLTVALAPPPGEAGLLGGRYSETVTITVSPI